MTASSINRQLADIKTRKTSTTPRIQQRNQSKVVEILLILIHFKYITSDKKLFRSILGFYFVTFEVAYMGSAMLELSTKWMATLNISWRWPLGRPKSVEKTKNCVCKLQKLLIIYLLPTCTVHKISKLPYGRLCIFGVLTDYLCVCVYNYNFCFLCGAIFDMITFHKKNINMFSDFGRFYLRNFVTSTVSVYMLWRVLWRKTLAVTAVTISPDKLFPSET